jgi:alkanesulfonate monooxygenase SsuD/methylene tetrahydromethanopterin reductase-like flavin-dependent oxidoreductase (luciferase family)
LIDFEATGWANSRIDAYTDAARDLGFDSLSANDHLVFQKPWLDGITALARATGRSGDMRLAMTISLPVVRHPNVLAKQAAALDILSGGRLVLGVGPGSSPRDYGLVGLEFEERWKRLDEAVRVLRSQLKDRVPPFDGAYYRTGEVMQPRPGRSVPIWIGSWGSEAGLRRVARLADGWLASAYNTTPEQLAASRALLDGHLAKVGKDSASFPMALATMWTYVTESIAERDRVLDSLAAMLNRPRDVLAAQVLVGSAEDCAEKLRAYAASGVGEVFIWPLADERRQLSAFMKDVAPRVP